MLDKFSHETFEALIGQDLEVIVEDISFTAEVEEVNHLTQQPGQERIPFSVVMQASVEESHGQRVYQIDHADLGKTDVFLVPIGPGPKGMRYEAVFT